MRLVFSGDWQCTLTNLLRCKLFVDQLIDVLQKSSKVETTYFIHTGDIKDQFNPIDQRVTNFIVESCNRIKQSCEGFYFVRGNHDSITTQDGVPSCVPLIKSLGAEEVADDNWIKVPIGLSTWNHKSAYLLLYLVPFFRSSDTQKQIFKEAGEDAAMPSYRSTLSDNVCTDLTKILVFHNSVYGCQQNLYTKGDGISSIDLYAKNYNLCIGGHIHLPQQIENIIYVGSPFAMDWSEVNYEHRILSVTINETQIGSAQTSNKLKSSKNQPF